MKRFTTPLRLMSIALAALALMPSLRAAADDSTVRITNKTSRTLYVAQGGVSDGSVDLHTDDNPYHYCKGWTKLEPGGVFTADTSYANYFLVAAANNGKITPVPLVMAGSNELVNNEQEWFGVTGKGFDVTIPGSSGLTPDSIRKADYTPERFTNLAPGGDFVVAFDNNIVDPLKKK